MRVVLLVAALCSILPCSAGAATWTEIRSPHYLFVGNAPRGDMRRIAQRFELFHAVMEQVLSRASLSFSAPTVVVVFKDDRSFRPYMPRYKGKTREVGGFALTANDLNYVALAADGDDAYRIVFHELAHLITSNVSRNSATWFSEGVAEFYSSFEMRGDDEVILGRPIGHHVITLHDQLMPMREFLRVDHTSPAYNEQSRSSLFYAQSWALVHYLHFNPATHGRFRDFARLADAGMPPEAAVERAFGMDATTLQNALRSYVRRFTMNAVRVPLDKPVRASAITDAEVSEASVLPHLAALLMRMDRLDEADERLKRALEREPESAIAHAMLAKLRLKQDRPKEALELLRRKVPYAGFLSNYLTASALAQYSSRQTSDTDRGLVASLRQHASAATEARGDVPEAWRLAAYAHLAADDTPSAAAAIDRAIALAPANEYYRFQQVDVLARGREFDRARGVLGALMASGRTADVRDDARRMMSRLVAYERAAKNPDARLASNATDPDAPSPAGGSNGYVPVFREPSPGETRIFAMLTGIECAPDGVTVALRAESGAVRVTAPSFDRIDFITYRPDLKGEIRCGIRSQPDPVYVTWAGQERAPGDIKAESIAVEFTPRDYKPQ